MAISSFHRGLTTFDGVGRKSHALMRKVDPS
jgi:hypothetical protein